MPIDNIVDFKTKSRKKPSKDRHSFLSDAFDKFLNEHNIEKAYLMVFEEDEGVHHLPVNLQSIEIIGECTFGTFIAASQQYEADMERNDNAE